MPWSEGILVTEKAMCLLLVLGAEKAKGFPCGSVGKESTCNAGDLGSIPRLGRSPGEGNGYPLQYSCLENSMDCIGEGNGTPLQYSCLENPMDGGAW